MRQMSNFPREYGDYRLPERERALRYPVDDETSDDPPVAGSRWWKKQMTIGNWATILGIVIAAGITWGEFKATAQHVERRLSKIEEKEPEIRKSYEALNEKLQDLKGSLRQIEERDAARGRQLDRIERQLDMLNGRRGSTP
jgi:septal ring factor EnvC (AmiA/AmiB activator)